MRDFVICARDVSPNAVIDFLFAFFGFDFHFFLRENAAFKVGFRGFSVFRPVGVNFDVLGDFRCEIELFVTVFFDKPADEIVSRGTVVFGNFIRADRSALSHRDVGESHVFFAGFGIVFHERHPERRRGRGGTLIGTVIARDEKHGRASDKQYERQN